MEEVKITTAHKQRHESECTFDSGCSTQTDNTFGSETDNLLPCNAIQRQTSTISTQTDDSGNEDCVKDIQVCQSKETKLPNELPKSVESHYNDMQPHNACIANRNQQDFTIKVDVSLIPKESLPKITEETQQWSGASDGSVLQNICSVGSSAG